MSGRRPRLVIKPNIRPGGAKTTPVSKPKPSQPPPASESSTKTLQAPATTLEKPAALEEDENLKLTEEKTKPPVATTDSSSISDSSAFKTQNVEPFDKGQNHGPGLELDISPQENDPSESDTHTEVNNVTQHSAESPAAFKAPEPLAIKAVETTSILSKRVDDSYDLTKPEDVSEAEGKKPDEPVELDESEASVASSLEPDSERQAEVDETVEKKPRRNRSRKPKLEALPSRDKSPDRQKMKMSDLLLWNPDRNFLPSKPKKKRNIKDENRPTTPEESIKVDDKADAMKETENAALPAPQVMIGPDGNVVLNTESLLISTPEKGDQSRSKIIVEEDDDDRYLNTNSYRKNYKKKLWSEEETDKFFIGLSMCGTDFSLLTKLLTNRSRRELKNKFRREEKFNRPRVDKSLSNMRQYDPSIFVEKPPPPPPTPKVKRQPKSAKKETKEIKTPVDGSKPQETLAKAAKSLGKEKIPAKKKAAKKRKHPGLSDDEEDDWGPEYDEVDEEEEMAARLPAYKTRPQRKAKSAAGWKEQMEVEDEEEDEAMQVTTPSLPTVQVSATSSSVPVSRPPMVEGAGAAPSTAGVGQTQPSKPPSGIQAIPGTTQVQIEVSGVQTPVQGMLIPSHMVPSLAPQLGLGEGAMAGRVQVLLVHEESTDGSLVHVYIIPEDDPVATMSQGSGAAPTVPGSLTSQVLRTSSNLSGRSTQQAVTGLGPVQTQHQIPHQATQTRPLTPASFSSPVHSPFPPTSPAGLRSQPQFSPAGAVRSSSPFPPMIGAKPASPFPPVAGMKSPPPFPPMTGVRSPSPFPPTAGGKSPAPYPPTTRASSSPFPPTPGSPSPTVLRTQSPFPPLHSGRKSSPFPPSASPTLGSPMPVEATMFPMSPPPLQGLRPHNRMPRPQPKVVSTLKMSTSGSRGIVVPPYSPASQTPIPRNPPIQNLMEVVHTPHQAITKSDTPAQTLPSPDCNTDKEARYNPSYGDGRPQEGLCQTLLPLTGQANIHPDTATTQGEMLSQGRHVTAEGQTLKHSQGLATIIRSPYQSPRGEYSEQTQGPGGSTGETVSACSDASLAVALSEAQEILLVSDSKDDDHADFAAVGQVEVDTGRTWQQPQQQ